MKTLTVIALLFIIGVATIEQNFARPTKDNGNIVDIYAQATDVQIYPNPVIGDYFSIKSVENIYSVELINVIGHTVFVQRNELATDQMKVYLTNCEKGLYLVKITFESKRTVIKKVLLK